MRRTLVAHTAFRPSVLGLLVGAASVLVVTVVLGATAVAETKQVEPRAVLEATHLPPFLVVPGEPVRLAFDVHCARAGVEDPEQGCALSGSLFLRPGTADRFREAPLAVENAGALTRFAAAVPSSMTQDPEGFQYYAEIRSYDGDRVRVPTGAETTYRSYPVRDAVDVDLSALPSRAARHGLRVVLAPWGDGSREVGLESGRAADPIGASSFDVDTSGAVVLLDEAHRRALRFAPGGREPEVIPLSIDVRIADLAVEEDASMDILESVASPGHHPIVRRFDRAGRQLDVVETAERSPSQVRIGPSGPVVLAHPSHLWMPIAVGRAALQPTDQLRRGRVGRPLRSGAEVVVLRTSGELRVALLLQSRVRTSWRIVSPDALGEVQLAETLGDRLVVVVRVYDDNSDEFRVLVLDRRGLVQQFSCASADWAETAPLSRFRLVGGSLYQLGSTRDGVFVNRYDLEVR